MKICLVAPCTVSGFVSGLSDDADRDHLSQVVRDLANFYVEHGHSVHVIKLNRFFTSTLLHIEGVKEVTVIPVRSRGYQLTLDTWRRERMEIVNAILKSAPDVIHAHWTYEYALAAIATGLPHVVTARDVPYKLFRHMHPRYYWWPRLLQGYWVARHARQMTGQSPYTVDLWKTKMGRRGPIELIPNAVSDSVMKIPLRIEKQVQEEPVFVSMFDGFFGRKNGPSLLQAFKVVRSAMPSARLLIFGYDSEPNGKAQTWAKSKGLSEGVEFRGRQPYIPMLEEIRRCATAMVHPSLEESFGMTIAEAMALEIPVIAGKNAGAVPWLLGDGSAGVLCDVTKPESLANAMLSLEVDSPMTSVATARVSSSFTLPPVGHAYLQLLESECER